MMNKEDVKKILEHYFSEQLGEGASDDIAQEICQLEAKPKSKYSPVTTDMPDAAVEQAFTPPDEGRLLETKVIINYMRELDIPTPTKEGYAFLKALDMLEEQDAKTAFNLMREYGKLVTEAYSKGYNLAQREKDAECEAKIEQIIKDDVTRCGGYMDAVREECQQKIEEIFQLFKDSIPCFPDLYGHGCYQDHDNCGECKHIMDIINCVRQALKDKYKKEKK